MRSRRTAIGPAAVRARRSRARRGGRTGARRRALAGRAVGRRRRRARCSPLRARCHRGRARRARRAPVRMLRRRVAAEPALAVRARSAGRAVARARRALARRAAPSGFDRWLDASASSLGPRRVRRAGRRRARARPRGRRAAALAREPGRARDRRRGPAASASARRGPPSSRRGPGVLLGLAIFSSDGCPMCRRLAPAIELRGRRPAAVGAGLRRGRRRADLGARRPFPGSPYAVALDAAGVALAKGTFNSLVQLESIVATARERESGARVAAADASPRPTRRCAAQQPPRLPRAPRRRRDRARRRAARRVGRAPRRGRRVHELLRPHLHDRQLPAPTGLPRIDRNGYPLRASDGVPVDDLGRPVNAKGQPIDAHGHLLTDADGVPLRAGAAHQDLRDARAGLRHQAAARRILVSLLRRPGAPDPRLLRRHQRARQRRRRARRLLLPGPPRLLRDLLRDLDAVLSGLAVAGALTRLSPASPAPGRRAVSR